MQQIPRPLLTWRFSMVLLIVIIVDEIIVLMLVQQPPLQSIVLLASAVVFVVVLFQRDLHVVDMMLLRLNEAGRGLLRLRLRPRWLIAILVIIVIIFDLHIGGSQLLLASGRS